MSELSTLQRRLAVELLAGDTAWSDAMLDAVVPGGSLDASGALGVYREGYFARLGEQLGETYATVWRVVGDERFFELCRGYIAAHRSSSYNLSDYGRDFAAHLASTPDAAEHRFLPDLARFELLFHDAFHAPQHDGLDGSAIASQGDLSGLRLRFGDSVRLFAAGHAVYDLFRRRHDAQAPDLDVARPQQVLLYKQDGELRGREIDAASYTVLEALAAAATIDEALERGCRDDAGFGTAEVTKLFEMLALCRLVRCVER